MSLQADSQRAAPAQFKSCVVIPFYNHPTTIGAVLSALRAFGLPCFVVDDASDEVSRQTITELARQEASWIQLLRHDRNQGKGGAVMTGCNAAFASGYSHALQIDADGQHDVNDVAKLLALAREHPTAVISGVPIYDESIPKSRLYGRYMTHIWVWINTLSLEIRDSMCGLRVYPLHAVVPLWNSTKLGRRMDFDVEVLVRLAWRGVRVVGLPTKVTYPADGISHFDAWRDNVAISGMHARLFFGMLMRLPVILGNRLRMRLTAT